MHLFCIFRIIATLFGLCMFLVGFFPLKHVSKSVSDQKISVKNPASANKLDKPAVSEPANSDQNVSLPRDIYSEKHTKDGSSTLPYKKIIFMIIDAFRSDFYFGPYKHMPRTRNIFEKGHGIKFIAEAHPPTVTMPRIKVRTSCHVKQYFFS